MLVWNMNQFTKHESTDPFHNQIYQFNTITTKNTKQPAYQIHYLKAIKLNLQPSLPASVGQPIRTWHELVHQPKLQGVLGIHILRQQTQAAQAHGAQLGHRGLPGAAGA